MLFGIGIASDSIIFSLGINQTKATCPDCNPNSGHLDLVRGFNFSASKTINSPIPLIIGFGYSRTKYVSENNSYQKKYNYLHASALYPYSLNLSSSKEIKVLAGIDFSLLFLTAYTSDFQIISGDWEFFTWDFEVPVDCGLLFGVDYKISNKSSISADYKFGLLDQLNSDYYEKFNQSFRINLNFHLGLDKESSDLDIIIY